MKIADLLAKICYLSLKSVSAPEDWKLANVTHIFRKGWRGDLRNERPVDIKPNPIGLQCWQNKYSTNIDCCNSSGKQWCLLIHIISFPVTTGVCKSLGETRENWACVWVWNGQEEGKTGQRGESNGSEKLWDGVDLVLFTWPESSHSFLQPPPPLSLSGCAIVKLLVQIPLWSLQKCKEIKGQGGEGMGSCWVGKCVRVGRGNYRWSQLHKYNIPPSWPQSISPGPLGLAPIK